MTKLPAPTLVYFCTLHVEIDSMVSTEGGRFGVRRMIPIRGGTVSGPHFTGRVLSGGADWQSMNADGLVELQANYAFETDDGAVIEILNSGLRHGEKSPLTPPSSEPHSPDRPYMRTYAKLQTGHPDYQWINRTIFCGTGVRYEDSVQIDLYAVE